MFVEKSSADYSISRKILIEDLHHQDSPGIDSDEHHFDGRNSNPTSSNTALRTNSSHFQSRSLQQPLQHRRQQLQPFSSDNSTQHSLARKNSSPKDVNQSQLVGCKQSHCKELLSKKDHSRMSSCIREVLKRNKEVDPIELKSKVLDNNCHFLDGQTRDPVALASAEGSGNTWVRGLLEKASGVCTGFNYCDYMMRMKGFIGENINSGSVLVVKTHTDNPQWKGQERAFIKYEAKYGSGIFLLRNPYDSLVAEWNRRLTNFVMIKQKMPHNESHTNVAPKEIWCEFSYSNFSSF